MTAMTTTITISEMPEMTMTVDTGDGEYDDDNKDNDDGVNDDDSNRDDDEYPLQGGGHLKKNRIEGMTEEERAGTGEEERAGTREGEREVRGGEVTPESRTET